MATSHYPVHAAGLRGYAPGTIVHRLRALDQYDILQDHFFTLGSEISTTKASIMVRVDPFSMVRSFLFCGRPIVSKIYEECAKKPTMPCNAG